MTQDGVPLLDFHTHDMYCLFSIIFLNLIYYLIPFCTPIITYYIKVDGQTLDGPTIPLLATIPVNLASLVDLADLALENLASLAVEVDLEVEVASLERDPEVALPAMTTRGLVARTTTG